MEFELLREDDYKPVEVVSVKMVRPSMGRARAYVEFCRRTYDLLGAGYRWLLEPPETLAREGSLVRAVAKKRDLDQIGFSEIWAVDEGEIVGIGVIRHTLTEEQRTWGGHVTVVVRGDVRNQGYGTEILRETVAIARRVVKGGPVLMTVDVANRAGWKTVRRATYEGVRVLTPKRKGWPKMVYQFRS